MSFLKKLLPSLVLPPILSAACLPPTTFVALTVDNFDFTREIITAARGAVTAAKYRMEAAHKEEGSAGLHAATRVPSRPVGLPHADAPPVATLMSKQHTVKLAEFYGFVEGHGCPRPSAAAAVVVVGHFHVCLPELGEHAY
jgi:hypothetical protein